MTEFAASGNTPGSMGTDDMESKTPDIELSILREIKAGGPVLLERALLVLSGLKTNACINLYQQKLDDIFGRFVKKYDNLGLSKQPNPPLYLHREIAASLFEYLWISKPNRFGKDFLLSDVVDAQLDPDVRRPVGTCIGLTSLYSVLALRAGLNLSLAAGRDHLLSRLRVGLHTIDIDNTDPMGFDCRNCFDFLKFPLLMLTANVLNARGLKKEREGDFEAAKRDYRKAILINPDYSNALNNHGNIRYREGDMKGAIADYTRAIRIDPCSCEPWCGRGMAKHRLGRFRDAREDYLAAIGVNPEYLDAVKCLQVLDTMERSRGGADGQAAS